MVTVVMTTYNPTPEAPRNQYAQRCVEGFERHLHTTDEVHLFATDDGSPEPFGPRWHGGFWSSCVAETGPHNGIGASLNRALRWVVGPWIYTTDDWLLTEPLDLELPLWLLTQGYDLVRLGPIHPNLWCRTTFTAGHGWWLDLDVQQDNLYVCATRPFLAGASLMAKIGPWLEGVDAYAAEYAFGVRCRANDVRAAAINLAGPWEHIGEFEVGDLPVEPFPSEKGVLA